MKHMKLSTKIAFSDENVVRCDIVLILYNSFIFSLFL